MVPVLNTYELYKNFVQTGLNEKVSEVWLFLISMILPNLMKGIDI